MQSRDCEDPTGGSDDMAALYPSQAWCDEWKKAINANSAIKEAGKNWGVGFNGNLVFEIQPKGGLETTTHVFMAVEAGECMECRIIEDPSTVDYGVYVKGNYSDFKEVVRVTKTSLPGL